MAGNNGGLDLIAALQHLLQNLLELGERRLSGYVVSALDSLFGDERECPAHAFRRVVERRLQSQLGIVQAIGIQFYFGAAGATSEEVDRAAAPDHIYRPLPGLRPSHGLNHYV